MQFTIEVKCFIIFAVTAVLLIIFLCYTPFLLIFICFFIKSNFTMLRKNRRSETVTFVFPLFLRPLYSLPFLTIKEISMLSYNTNSNFISFLISLAIPFHVCFIDNIRLKVIGSKMNAKF